ncbi:hypothetical protein CBL_09642, partial [Carabus blaptoides fortunei]
MVGGICTRPNAAISFKDRKSSIPGKTPLELWSGKTFDRFDYLRIFGSECYVNVPTKFRSKFENMAVLGHFVGYVNEKDGYKVWFPSEYRVVKSHNVDFQVEFYLNHHDEEQSTDARSVGEYSDELNDYEIDYQAHRSKNSALACLEEVVREELAPTNFHDAMKSCDSNKWLNT